MSTALFELEQRLGGAVSEVLETALAVDPPGASSPAWEGVLLRYGVNARPEDERYAAAKRERMFRGAPFEEVGGCLGVLAGRFLRQLAVLTTGGPDFERLRTLLEGLPAAGLDHYKRLACEKPKGGMFGHAMAAAKQHKYDGYTATRGYVLKCPHCGAPRLREEDFRCAFCGELIAGGAGGGGGAP